MSHARYSTRLSRKIALLSLSSLLLTSGFSAALSPESNAADLDNQSEAPSHVTKAQNAALETATTGSKSNEFYLGKFYATVGIVPRPVAGGGVNVESAARGIWFSSDGYYAKTATGVGKFRNLTSFCNEHPRRCGRYRVQNGRYILQNTYFDNSEPEVYTFSASGDRLSNGEITYERIQPLPSWVLSGSYRRLLSGSNAYIHSFDQNGNFAIARVNRSTNGYTQRRGTYHIEDYTITYRFDDGEVKVESFYILEDAPFIDGDWYEYLG